MRFLVRSLALHGIQRPRDNSCYLQKGFLGGAIAVSVPVNPWLLSFRKSKSKKHEDSEINSTFDDNLNISQPMVFRYSNGFEVRFNVWIARHIPSPNLSPYPRFSQVTGAVGGMVAVHQRSKCQNVLHGFWYILILCLPRTCIGPFSFVHAIEISWATWYYNVATLLSHQHPGAELWDRINFQGTLYSKLV